MKEEVFSYKGKKYKVKWEERKGEVIINEKKKYKIKQITKLTDNILVVNVEDKVYTLYLEIVGEEYFLFVNGVSYFLEKIEKTTYTKTSSLKPISTSVTSPMPGLLVKLLVKEGMRITSGEVVAIVEAMKMENELRSPITGVVKSVNAKEGEQVQAFTPIVELEPKK